jgi:hypothetical protein
MVKNLLYYRKLKEVHHTNSNLHVATLFRLGKRKSKGVGK